MLYFGATKLSCWPPYFTIVQIEKDIFCLRLMPWHAIHFNTHTQTYSCIMFLQFIVALNRKTHTVRYIISASTNCILNSVTISQSWENPPSGKFVCISFDFGFNLLLSLVKFVNSLSFFFSLSLSLTFLSSFVLHYALFYIIETRPSKAIITMVHTYNIKRKDFFSLLEIILTEKLFDLL